MTDRTHTARRRRATSALAVVLAALPLMLAPGALANHGDYLHVITPSTQCDVTKDAQGNVTGQDAGNSMATATPLFIPSVCRGSLTQGTDDVDWYRIDVTVGRTITIERIIAEPPLFSLELKMFDSQGNEVIIDGAAWCRDNATIDSCGQQHLEVNDTYYMRLTREAGNGPYEMRTVGEQAQNDCGTPGDAGQEQFGATLPSEMYKTLTLPGDPTTKARSLTCHGLFQAPDKQDGFRVYMAAGQVVTVDVTNQAKTLQQRKPLLSDPATFSSLFDECAEQGSPQQQTLWGKFRCKVPTYSGRYYLDVLDGQANRNDTTVDWKVITTVEQDDCGDPSSLAETTSDAPDSVTTQSERRPFGERCVGMLDAAPATSAPGSASLDTVDRLSTQSDAGTVKFSLVAPPGNCAKMKVTPPGGTAVETTTCAASTVQATGGGGTWDVDVTYVGFSSEADPTTYPGGKYEVLVGDIVPFENDCDPGDANTVAVGMPTRFNALGVLQIERSKTCSGDLRPATDVDTYLLATQVIVEDVPVGVSFDRPAVGDDGGAANESGVVTNAAVNNDIVEVSLAQADQAQVCLYDPTGTLHGCGKTVTSRATTLAMEGGTSSPFGAWKAEVKGAPASHTPYTLEMKIISQADCGDVNPAPAGTEGRIPTYVDGGNSESAPTRLPQAKLVAPPAGFEPAEYQFCEPVDNQRKNARLPDTPLARLSGQLRHVSQDAADWYAVDLDRSDTSALAVVLSLESMGDPRISPDVDLIVVRPDGTRVTGARPPSVPETEVVIPTCQAPPPPAVPTCAGRGTWKIGVVRVTGNVPISYRLLIAGRN